MIKESQKDLKELKKIKFAYEENSKVDKETGRKESRSGLKYFLYMSP